MQLGSHIFDHQLSRLSPLTQDPVGQPFRVLSFLPYSQTLGPSSPSLPILCLEAFPRCSSATVGLRPLEQRYLFRIPLILCFSRRPCLTTRLHPGGRFRRFGRSSGTYLLEVGGRPGGSGHSLRQLTGQRSGHAPGIVASASPPVHLPGDAFQAAVVAIFARPVKRRVGSSRQQEIRATLARRGGGKSVQ